MSTLTDQIKAKCATIAENQRLIYEKGKSEGGGGSYEQGFADGKASVEAISFYVDYRRFVALKGMTWREYAGSIYDATEEFTIDLFNGNDVINFCGTAYVDASPDDEIVPNGDYRLLEDLYVIDGDNTLRAMRNYYESAESFINSERNTIGLWIDSSGYIRTATNRYLVEDAYLATERIKKNSWLWDMRCFVAVDGLA